MNRRGFLALMALGASRVAAGTPSASDFCFADPAGGVDHVARAFIPTAPAPAAGWPALVALDGTAVAELVTPPADRIVIALGHARPDRFATLERARDYTPPGAVTDPMGRPAGGAAGFLSLLTSRILPRLAAEMPLDPARLALWGHSYGGLFALYAAFSGKSPFIHHIAASPSLWWDDGRFWRALLAHLPANAPQVRIDTHAGTAENAPSKRAVTPQMQPMLEMRARTPWDAVDRLAAALRQAGVSGDDLRFAGLGHGPAFAASLRAALAGP